MYIKYIYICIYTIHMYKFLCIKNMRTYVYNICIHVYKFYIRTYRKFVCAYIQSLYTCIYILKTEKAKKSRKKSRNNRRKQKAGKNRRHARFRAQPPSPRVPRGRAAREDERATVHLSGHVQCKPRQDCPH